MKDRSPVALAALVVGVVFLLLGILGFVPGTTTDYDTLGLFGRESEAKLLGLFQVSVLHNIVHLLFGIAGIAAAGAASKARAYLMAGGAIYLALTLFGAVIDFDSGINFVPLNAADNGLHLFLAIGMLGLGIALGKKASSSTSKGAA